ncbi:MAG: elongation factor P maturation arginine rhamnosyltransferase EarP, partial [Paraburkholderia sp.]
HALAFTDQPGYDALLWASDLNFVRGEDSFVRAQWAARPFVWHIYPQADDAHLPKLDAALAHYTAPPLPSAARAALARFWHAWNGVGEPDWADFQRHRAAFEQRAAGWAQELAALGDLAGNLAEFAKSQLK